MEINKVYCIKMQKETKEMILNILIGVIVFILIMVITVLVIDKMFSACRINEYCNLLDRYNVTIGLS